MVQLILQPDAAAGWDNFLAVTEPTVNYGTNINLLIGDSTSATFLWRSLIRFDLSSIPADATITSAVMTLYYEKAGSYRATNNRTCRVYRVKKFFTEGGSNWTRANGTPLLWQIDGCGGSTDRETIDIGTGSFVTSASVGDPVTFTLDASKIQEMITDGIFTNNGFLLKTDTENDDAAYIHSSDGGTANLRPKLVINYTTPSTGNMLLVM